jgi:hypothetical protein
MTDVMGSCNKLTKEKKTHIAVVTEVGCCAGCPSA